MAFIVMCKFYLNFYVPMILGIQALDQTFSSGRAQCMLGSLFGKLEDRMVCCGSIVLKRKQGLTDDQVENCPGELVDIIPKVCFQIDASNSLSDWFSNFFSKWKALLFDY